MQSYRLRGFLFCFNGKTLYEFDFDLYGQPGNLRLDRRPLLRIKGFDALEYMQHVAVIACPLMKGVSDCGNGVFFHGLFFFLL